MNRKTKLSFDSFEYYKEKIYFSAFDHNGIYCADKNGGKATLLCKVPNEPDYAIRLYSTIKRIEDKLIFVPFNAKSIFIYDVRRDVSETIPLKDTESNEYTNGFWSSVTYNDKIFMMPHDYKAMVILDIKSNQVEYFYDFVEDIKKDLSFRPANPFITDCILEGSVCYCSCCAIDAVLSINLDTLEYKIIKIASDGDGFNGILKEDCRIWLAPRLDGSIICYDIQSEKIIYKTCNYPEKYSNSFVPFHALIDYNEEILLVPNHSNQFILMNKDSGEMRSLSTLMPLLDGDYLIFICDKLMACSLEEDRLFFVVGLTYDIYEYNIASDELIKLNIWTDGDYPSGTGRLRNMRKEAHLVITENSELCLSSYIDYIIEK